MQVALQDTGASKSKAPRTAQARYLAQGSLQPPQVGPPHQGCGCQEEVCRTDLVMEVDQGKTPSYGAYFILTTKDVPPSAGKCRYDRKEKTA